MSDWIDIKKDPQHVAKEKAKARELRQSAWWKNLVGQGICHYCQKKFPPADLTMDHIVPIARGGRSIRSNVVVCCKACNNDKKYKTPAEMILDSLKKN